MTMIGMEAKFIGILSEDKNNFVVIPKLWGEFKRRTQEINDVVKGTDYGICYNVPGTKSHPDEFCYLACVQVKNTDKIPKGMISKTIKAGKYACFTHKGPIENFEHTMKYIFGSWLPKSGKTLRKAPDIEVYDHRFNILNQENSELEIWIPIE